MSGTFAAGDETELYGIGSGDIARAPSLDVLANTLGSMFSEENPTGRLFGAIGRGAENVRARLGTVPQISAEEANERFGIEGVLRFSAPLAESSARELQQLAQERVARASIAARASDSYALWTARAALSLAAAVADPLNVASAFVPAVGPTRAAAWLAGATTRGGRIAASARIGAVEGLAGAVALEPLLIGLASLEGRQDYGMADSLLNIAFGPAFGALLHGGGRAIIDGFRGWSPSPRLAAETHEASVRAAVAQVERGEPVNVAPIFQAARAAPDPEARPSVALTAEGDIRRAEIRGPDGETIGQVEGQAHGGVVRIHGAELAEGARGQGLGVDAYRTIIDDALARGETVASDGEVSLAAARVYDALERRGYAVERAEAQAMNDGAGPLVAADGGPVFRVTAGPERVASPSGGAPEPPTPEAIRATAQSAAPTPRPEDAAAVAAAADARVRAEAGARVETPAAKIEAETAGIEARVTEQDRVLAEMVRAGRITEAEAAATIPTAAEARVRERVKGIEAAAACLIANGA